MTNILENVLSSVEYVPSEERMLDAALGLIVLGSIYKHCYLVDNATKCYFCNEQKNSASKICYPLVPSFKDDIAKCYALLSRITACSKYTVININYTNNNWVASCSSQILNPVYSKEHSSLNKAIIDLTSQVFNINSDILNK